MDDKGWMVTLGDMLTLLLTFFVFLITISVFKTEEYRQFWALLPATVSAQKTTAQSFRFPLIRGLRMPLLTPAATELLDEVSEVIENGNFRGADLYYTENKIALMISESLGFASGATQLQPEAERLLRAFVPRLRQTSFPISVEGHTDSTPLARTSNMELSLQRALTVGRLLQREGLDPRRIAVAGYGETRPLAANDSEAGRRLNRRVEIHIIIKH